MNNRSMQAAANQTIWTGRRPIALSLPSPSPRCGTALPKKRRMTAFKNSIPGVYPNLLHSTAGSRDDSPKQLQIPSIRVDFPDPSGPLNEINSPLFIRFVRPKSGIIADKPKQAPEDYSAFIAYLVFRYGKKTCFATASKMPAIRAWRDACGMRSTASPSPNRGDQEVE